MYVQTHLHSYFSPFDGACDLPSIVRKASLIGMPACALTDHGVMTGSYFFHKECRKNGIKPILGVESYLAENSASKKPVKGEKIYHLILLAKNKKGFENLCSLSRESYRVGAIARGKLWTPRIDREMLLRYKEGIMVGSACIDSPIYYNAFINNNERMMKWIHFFADHFKDDFYFEVMNPHMKGPEAAGRITQMTDISRHYGNKFGLPVVSTFDAHYVDKEQNVIHDILMRTGSGGRIGSDGDYYMPRVDELSSYGFKEEEIDNTNYIASKVEEYDLLPKGKLYPVLDQEEEKLSRLVKKRVKERGIVETEEVSRRIEKELKLIQIKGFSSYFITLYDLLAWCREHDILIGIGRGSAGGSIIAWILGLTQVNPLEYGLLFERFLTMGRSSLPDVDIDIQASKRYLLLDHIKKIYGDDNVLRIGTIQRLQAKSSVRDAAAALNVKPSMMRDVLDNAKSLDSCEEMNHDPVFLKKFDDVVGQDVRKEIMGMAVVMEGKPRQYGGHPAGVCIMTPGVKRSLPVFTSKSGEEFSLYDMDMCEEIGLMKIDFLVLTTLDVIAELQKETRHLMKDLPEDPLVYELFAKGNTEGIFQYESDGIRSLLMDVKPANLEEMAAVNALFRPGPLESGMNEEYVAAKNTGRVKVIHPLLKDILSPTYGTLVYQEQVMMSIRALAGYTEEEADRIRKIIGKKKIELMPEEEKIFTRKCGENGISSQSAKNIFKIFWNFGKYAFNKSHAIAYSKLAYNMGWYKKYYPVEFHTACLNFEDKKDKKIRLVHSALKNGITFANPNINSADINFVKIDAHTIKLGISSVKGLGEKVLVNIFKTLGEKGKFTSFDDFRARVKKSNKTSLTAIAKAGGFDDFTDRMSALTGSLTSQLSFSFDEGKTETMKKVIESEIDALGMPLSWLGKDDVCWKFARGTNIYIHGVVIGIEFFSSKRGKAMQKMTLYDSYMESKTVYAAADVPAREGQVCVYRVKMTGANYWWIQSVDPYKFEKIDIKKKEKKIISKPETGKIIVEINNKLDVARFIKHFKNLEGDREVKLVISSKMEKQAMDLDRKFDLNEIRRFMDGNKNITIRKE